MKKPKKPQLPETPTIEQIRQHQKEIAAYNQKWNAAIQANRKHKKQQL